MEDEDEGLHPSLFFSPPDEPASLLLLLVDRLIKQTDEGSKRRKGGSCSVSALMDDGSLQGPIWPVCGSPTS